MAVVATNCGGAGVPSGGATLTRRTLAADIPAGAAIEIRCNASNSATISTVSDGVNTYTAVVNTTVDGARVAVYRAQLSALLPSGTNIDVTWGGTSGNRVIHVTQITGHDTASPICFTPGTAFGNPANTTPTYTSGAPSAAPGLMTAGICVLGGQGTALTHDADWTVVGSTYADIGSTILYVDAISFATAVAQDWTGSLAAAKLWNISMVGWKEAPAVSGGGLMLLGVG